MQDTISYEQPLNERIRALMRLEFLFQQASHATTGQSAWDTRAALPALFDILDLTAGRNELKSELLKELERQSNTLGRLSQSPGVDAGTLNAILEELRQVSKSVHELNNASLEKVRQNDFLVAIRQRSSIPGGACIFDLPSLHYWLQKHPSTRSRYLTDWLRPFQPIQEGVRLILHLIRSSAIPSEEIAAQGFFQKTLDSGAPSQMVRVTLPAESGVFPEISGGRHRFSIRFMEQPNPNTRAIQSSREVFFQLACCVI